MSLELASEPLLPRETRSNAPFSRIKRRARGLSQADVAGHLGVEQETVSRVERGATMVPLGRLSDIANFFGVPTFVSTGAGQFVAEEKRIGNLFSLLSTEQQELVRSRALAMRVTTAWRHSACQQEGDSACEAGEAKVN